MKTETLLNYTPALGMGVRETKGNLFGIELELEGRNVGLKDIATRGWERHAEPSLRGESMEYTTNGGKTLDEAKKLVSDLFKKFSDNGVMFNNSIRTSTHVHLNFSDKKIKQVVNFFAVFTLVEELLQFYSGEDRKGNLFCVSSREAAGIVEVLSGALESGDFRAFAGDRFKYAACNLCTLFKFGTVEIRTMRGANSAEQVNKWLDILNDLYEFSLKMKSPVELVQNISLLGADGLLREIFKPENLTELMKTFPKAYSVHQSLMEGARLIQVFAYEFEDAFNVEVKEPDVGAGEIYWINIRGPNHVGHCYAIYRPDGALWNCTPRRVGRRPPAAADFWRDGDVCTDDSRLKWSQERQRFIVEYPNGDVVECKWARHHSIPAERIDRIRDMPPFPRRDHVLDDLEFEEEPDVDVPTGSTKCRSCVRRWILFHRVGVEVRHATQLLRLVRLNPQMVAVKANTWFN